MGVETGGCPHTAIREDASMNLAAIEDMNRKFPHAELCFVESGGDNLAVHAENFRGSFWLRDHQLREGRIPPSPGLRHARANTPLRHANRIRSVDCASP